MFREWYQTWGGPPSATGPGSGNRGHKGIPGSRGGSLPQGASGVSAVGSMIVEQYDISKMLPGAKDWLGIQLWGTGNEWEKAYSDNLRNINSAGSLAAKALDWASGIPKEIKWALDNDTMAKEASVLVTRDKSRAIMSVAIIENREKDVYVDTLVSNPGNYRAVPGASRGGGAAVLYSITKLAAEQNKGVVLSSTKDAVPFYKKMGFAISDGTLAKMDTASVDKFIERYESAKKISK